jgi:hypothetical protein
VRFLLPIVLALILAAEARGLSPDRIAFWKGVARCETGERWDWGSQYRNPIYEGGVGFATTTWRAWAAALGLLRRYPDAFDAPMLVQMRVAEYGLERGGYWGCLH